MTHHWIPELWMCLPFAGLLFAIALLPLWRPHFWHALRNQALIAALFSLPVTVFVLQSAPHLLAETLRDYVSFVILLGSLFIVAGGIMLRGDLKGTPWVNTCFLALGSVLSNFIGTTGASMILIRPLLTTNGHRKHHVHIPIFFIMLVSNIGGLLTPLGDPPLFLGYLKGIPFFWTLKLFPLWLFANLMLLGVFFCLDHWILKREPHLVALDTQAELLLDIKGRRNLLLFPCIIAAVFLSVPFREVAMVAAALVSLKITPKAYRKENNFTYAPILEVAILFLGIFMAMIPALELLRIRGGELGVRTPWQFFWATGSFSSFLDNAPTYLTFVALAQGLGLDGPHLKIPETILIAISAGAVFFGANTYIGNAPNFMVRSISAAYGWKMPSFFGYMVWSIGILLPLFGLVTFFFFRS